MNYRLPALVLVTLLSGCTIIEQPPIVVTEGPTCGQGTVLRGNQCVAVQQGPTCEDYLEINWVCRVVKILERFI